MDHALEPATSGPTLAPASLQRIRCFLQTRGRMKVKPWAPAEEVLDALRRCLEARHDDRRFWVDLSLLLDALCRDAVARSTGAHDLMDNELLAPARIERLLEEIRDALKSAPTGHAPFRALAGSLSGPGAALLLLLGSATIVGCYRSHMLGADGSVMDASPPDARRLDAARADASIRDAAPRDVGPLDSGPVCDPVTQVAECTLTPELSDQLCACIEALNESWQTALRQLVDRTGCSFLSNQAYCLLNACADPAAAGDFDLETFLDGCSAPLYLGVRFD
ncbi:MAG: hypothetical protein GXP55_12355 [Deltaproteobacteria bacterium]|nr:hypothetical protein [Deltaproteobacteria bacterium]